MKKSRASISPGAFHDGLSQEEMRTLIMNRYIHCILWGLFLFVVSLLVVKLYLTGWSIGSDGLGYYAHLRSFVIDFDLDYENEFRDFNPRNHAVPNVDAKTASGLVPNKYPIGPALLWTPFFFLAHGLTGLVRLVGGNVPANGYSLFYQFLIGLGPQLYAICGLTLILRLILFFYPLQTATLSLLTVTLSTNVIYYMTVESTMSHAFSLFAVALFMYYGTKTYGQKTEKQFFFFGLLGALMTLIRYQNGLFMLFPLFELTDRIVSLNWRKTGIYRLFRRGAAFLFGFLLGIVPQLLVWKIIYGDFLLYTYKTEGFQNTSGGAESTSHFIDILFSLNHGLIAWTPILLFCLLGLAFFIHDHKKFGLFFLLLFLGQYLINANWQGWSFGVSYSSRAFVNCTFIFCAGLAALLNHCSLSMRYILPGLFGFIGWNFLLIIQYTFGYIPLQGVYTWSQICTNQLIVLKDIMHLLLPLSGMG